MDKMDKQILVVPRAVLFPHGRSFEGFVSREHFDYESLMVGSYMYMRRGDAEVDPSFKQPIAYCLIVNPELKTVFAYKRAENKEHYQEGRLQGKWSWGVGGHIDEIDVEDKNSNPIHISMLRELEEEVTIMGSKKPRVLGYVNNDEDEVGKVHIGVLYLVETDAREVLPKDKEMAEGRMMELSELEEILESPDCVVEGWSKIAYGAVKDYFASC